MGELPPGVCSFPLSSLVPVRLFISRFVISHCCGILLCRQRRWWVLSARPSYCPTPGALLSLAAAHRASNVFSPTSAPHFPASVFFAATLLSWPRTPKWVSFSPSIRESALGAAFFRVSLSGLSSHDVHRHKLLSPFLSVRLSCV